VPSEKIFNQDAEKVKDDILSPTIKPMSIFNKVSEQLEAEKGKPEIEIKSINEESEESKADKFKRLVQIRVSRILDDIDLLGNLSTANYEYTPEQINKIFTAIIEELTKTKEKFKSHSALRFTL
jgi:ABC-type uncharacterized transport system ATPase component